MIRSFLAAGLLMLAALPALADDNTVSLPPEGTTIINFSATERRTMPQDLLTASLRIELEDKTDAVAIQKKINEAMTKALEIVKKEPGFKISTGAYSVYKTSRQIIVNTKTGESRNEDMWVGAQTIDIESKDAAKVLDATGKIQALGFAMNNLGYSLSPDVEEKTRDELMVLALKKLTAKAQTVATTLGKSKADLINVNVDGGGPVVPMYKTMAMEARGMAADAAMPPPVAQAGETDVSVTVSAQALIRP